MNERATLTVAEAARVLGIGRNLTYELVRRGELPSLKLGSRVVIPRVALERLLGEAQFPLLNGSKDNDDP